jgi:cytochrome c-type biogenesis protein CcmH/NrfG
LLSPIRDDGTAALLACREKTVLNALQVQGSAARPGARFDRVLRFWPVFAFIALVPLAALSMYVLLGARTRTAAPASHIDADSEVIPHVRAMSISGLGGGDLDAAITRLRARLAVDSRDPEGWRLLAQSYEYLGRTELAADASRRAVAAERGEDASADAPGPDGTAQEAQEHRRRREFAAANRQFAELAQRGEMNADLWADYADSLGGEHGNLEGDAARAIDAALKLDDRHAKALWLRGSLQTQRRDYRAALVTWQRLAQVLPADSPDMRFINANIDEARARLGAPRE